MVSFVFLIVVTVIMLIPAGIAIGFYFYERDWRGFWKRMSEYQASLFIEKEKQCDSLLVKVKELTAFKDSVVNIEQQQVVTLEKRISWLVKENNELKALLLKAEDKEREMKDSLSACYKMIRKKMKSRVM